MRYIVTADRPTCCSGDRATFDKGDVLTVDEARGTDDDGDYLAVRVSDEESGYILAEHVTPLPESGSLLDERVIRAAFAAAGVLPTQVEAILAEARRAAL